MNDVYIEQLVHKKRTTQDTALMIFICVAAAVVAFCCFYFSMVFAPFFILLIFLGIGALYLGWYLLRKVYVEFEYCVTNGELDVDKIVARTKRTRLVTAKGALFETGGRYDAEKLARQSFTTRLFAGADQSPQSLYVTFRHHKLGNTLLVFSPDDRVLEAMRGSTPFAVWNDLSKAAKAIKTTDQAQQ